MAGIFGIIGDISNAKILESTNNVLDYESSKSVNIDSGTYLGLTYLKFQESEIYTNNNLTVLLNGEFYSDKLNATNSTKEIFDLYMAYGDNFISMIDGIFNICMYDKQNQILKIFNDWAGNHNLFYYYSSSENKFIFSTETKGILKIIKNKHFNYEAAITQVMFSHILYDDTLVNEIKLLPPASILTYKNKILTIESYYDLRNNYNIINEKNEKYLIDKLYDGFVQPTKKYLHKKKISLPLTGGMDSRFLLHILLENNYNLEDTFTGGDPDSDDVRIAQMIAKRYSISHRLADVHEDYFKSKFYDNYYIHEGFLAPHRYGSGLELHYNRGIENIIQFPNSNLTLGDLYTPNTKHFIGNLKLNDQIKNQIISKFLKVEQSVLNILFIDYNKYTDGIISRLFDYFENLAEYPSIFIFDYFAWYQHSRRWSNLGGMNGKFIGRIAPSQDRQLNEFIFNIPIEYKYWQYIHKKMFKTKCPNLAKLPREGTGVPISWPEPVQMLFKAYRKNIYNRVVKNKNTNRIANFYRDIVHEEIEALQCSSELKDRGIFDPIYVKKLWDQHLKGKDNTYLIHNILNIELFFRNYID